MNDKGDDRSMKILEILAPLLISSVVFGVLDHFLPGTPLPLAFLSIAIVSFTVAMWFRAERILGELERIRRKSFDKVLGRIDASFKSSVYDGHNKFMKKAFEVVSKERPGDVSAYVYQSYPLSLDQEGEYFSALVEALNTRKINELHRIVNIQEELEIDAVVDAFKRLARVQRPNDIYCYVRYSRRSNYFSFLAVEQMESVIGFPKLDSPVQGSGIYVNDVHFAHRLQDIFNHIKSHEVVGGRIALPEPEAIQEWKDLEKSLRASLAEAK